MPKLKPSEHTVRNAYRRGMIQQGVTAKLTTPERVAKGMGISRATYTRRLADPETLTVAEVESLAGVLGWDSEDITEFMRGAKR